MADALIKVPLPLGSLSSHLGPGNLEFRVACLREVCITWAPLIARNSSSSFPGSKVPYAFMAAHQRPSFSLKWLLLSADLQTLGRGKVSAITRGPRREVGEDPVLGQDDLCSLRMGHPRLSINHLDLSQLSVCCMSMIAFESNTIFIHLSFLPSSNQFHLSNIYWLSAINKHCDRNVRYMWWTHTVVPALTEREKQQTSECLSGSL